jgi:plasmid maintenance system killer protein
MIDEKSIDTKTLTLYDTGEWPGLSYAVKQQAIKVMDKLDAADTWDDVRKPPARRLEKMPGTRPARYALHVKDEYWLTFGWKEPYCMDLRLEKPRW